MIRRSLVVALGLGLALAGPARTVHADAGEELTVHVLTVGPGDHPYFSLGESAIWIQDERAGTGVVYHFGALEPDSPWSALTWMTGRLTNRLSRVPTREALQTYQRANRTVETQDLELSPAARVALHRELERSALPENRDYAYDPFSSSGSTRVRDVIDHASGGRLRATSQGVPSGVTLRQETLRLTRNLVPAYLIVYLVQGAASDRPLDQWDRMFVPSEVQKTLRRIGRAGSWNDPPLVASEATICAAHRNLPPQHRAVWSGGLVVAGLAIGTVLALAGRMARRRPRLRGVFAALMGMIGLMLGLVGSALVLGWFLGDHTAARLNENILQLAPWVLVLPLLAVGVAAGRPSATRQAFQITAAAAALAGSGLLLKAAPWFRQDNLPLIGLFLPTWAGLAAGLRALERE